MLVDIVIMLFSFSNEGDLIETFVSMSLLSKLTDPSNIIFPDPRDLIIVGSEFRPLKLTDLAAVFGSLSPKLMDFTITDSRPVSKSLDAENGQDKEIPIQTKNRVPIPVSRNQYMELAYMSNAIKTIEASQEP